MPPSRFEGINFPDYIVIEIAPHLMETLNGGFRCKRGEFGTYWKRGRIRREVESYLCRCWIIQVDLKLAGYVTLLTDKLVLEEEKLAEEGVRYTTFPAVKIGLLASDERAKGAGKRLVEWALEYAATEIYQKVGVRFVTVDAFYDKDPDEDGNHYDASGFYAKLGFEFVNVDERLPPRDGYRTMYYDLKPLIDAFSVKGQDNEDQPLVAD